MSVSMSNVPFYVPRGEIPYGGTQMNDGIVYDGLTDVYNKFHMGVCGERTATKFAITRAQQDEFAINSYKRTAAAAALMTSVEITPIEIPATKTVPASVMNEDEEVRKKGEQYPCLIVVGSTYVSYSANASSDWQSRWRARTYSL